MVNQISVENPLKDAKNETDSSFQESSLDQSQQMEQQ